MLYPFFILQKKKERDLYMNNIIDTKDLITFGEDFPKLLIGDKAYEVNDLKETADKIDEVFANTELSQKEKEAKIMDLALGEENAKELMAKKMNVKSYRNLVQLVMATIQGITLEEFKKQIEQKN